MRRKKRLLMLIAMMLSFSIITGTVTSFGAAATDAVKSIKEDGGLGKSAYTTDEGNPGGDYSEWNEESNAIECEADYVNRLFRSGAESALEKGSSLVTDEELVYHAVNGNIIGGKFAFDVTDFTGEKDGAVRIRYTGYKIAHNGDHAAKDKNGFVPVDVVATVTNWTIAESGRYVCTRSAFEFSEKLTGGYPTIQMCNIGELTVRYDYYVAGTDTEYDLKTNATYRDIDGGQGIAFRSKAIQKTAVTPDTNLMYAKNGSWHVFTSSYLENGDENDSDNALGLMYDAAGEEITYISGQQDSDGNETFGTPSGRWAMFAPSTYSWFDPQTPPPTKSVTDSNETDDDHLTNTINGGEALEWTYEVTQAIPAGVNTAFYYDEFIMEDAIDTCLDITRVKVLNRSRDDVTDKFTVTTDNNKVKATAKSSYLNDEDFYGGASGNSMILQIKVKVNAGKLKENYDSHGHFNEPKTKWTAKNSAKTSIDGNIQDSPEVTTTVNLDWPETEPLKRVTDSNETRVTENRLTAPDEKYTYEVMHPIGEGYNEITYFKSYKISDVLEKILEPVSAKVYLEEGGTKTDVSSRFDIKINGQSVTASMKEENLTKSSSYPSGASYILTIETRIRTEEYNTQTKLAPWLSADGLTITVPNKGRVETTDLSPAGSHSRQTNEVKTTVGLPQTEEGEPGLDIKKSADPYEFQVGDEIPYIITISQNNPDATAYKVKCTDTSFPQGFSVKKDSFEVSGMPREYKISGADTGFTFSTDYLKHGETVTIKFKAVAEKNLNGTVVPNTAAASAWGVPEKDDSTTVYINSPKMDVEKSVSKEDNVRIGDTVNYEVAVRQVNRGCFMRNIHLEDGIKTEGVKLDKGSFSVTDMEGNMLGLNTDYRLKVKGNEFTMTFVKGNMGYHEDPVIPAADDARGKATGDYEGLDLQKGYIVTYTATIDDDALSGRTVKNLAEVPATKNTNGDVIKDDPDIPSGGDEDEAAVKVRGPSLRPEKEPDKYEYAEGDTARYRLEVNQTEEGMTARNVVIKDQMVQSGMAAIKEDSIKVRFNGRIITGSCRIIMNTAGDGFVIHTGKDLADGDRLTVDYEAEMLAAGTLQNTLTVSADNAPQATWDNYVTVLEKPALNIVKTSDKKQYKVGDTGRYTLSVTQTKDFVSAENVTVTDIMDKTGMRIKNIKVMLDGKDITKRCRINNDKDEFNVKTGISLKKGQILKITYDVLFGDESLAGKKVTNTATAEADNAVKAEDVNRIDILKGPALDIEKSSDKKKYSVGETGRYTLTVKQKVKGVTAENVVIKDSFDRKGIELAEKDITVKHGKKDITKSCRITMDDDGGFTVKTGRDLKYGEKMKVTYRVLFKAESLAGKKVKNTAVASADNAEKAKTDETVKIRRFGYIVIGDPEGGEPGGESRSGGSDGRVATGDSSGMIIIACIILLAGSAAAAAVTWRRKK